MTSLDFLSSILICICMFVFATFFACKKERALNIVFLLVGIMAVLTLCSAFSSQRGVPIPPAPGVYTRVENQHIVFLKDNEQEVRAYKLVNPIGELPKVFAIDEEGNVSPFVEKKQ